MKTEDLHQALEQLHEELARAERVDAESERLLRDLLLDIAKLLAARQAGGGKPSDDDSGIAERLGDASKRLEDQYPRLVTLIGRVADALSRLGV